MSDIRHRRSDYRFTYNGAGENFLARPEDACVAAPVELRILLR